jgi:cell division protease FtsH
MTNTLFFLFFIKLLFFTISNGYNKNIINKKQIFFKNIIKETKLSLSMYFKNNNYNNIINNNNRLGLNYNNLPEDNIESNKLNINSFKKSNKNKFNKKNKYGYEDNYKKLYDDNNIDEDEDENEDDEFEDKQEKKIYEKEQEYLLRNLIGRNGLGIRVIVPRGYIKNNNENSENEYNFNNKKRKNVKSDNFEVTYDKNLNFSSIGGYDIIKNELLQCSDILVNFTKYSKYNVRIPKGIILEGPPGNGKTLITKAFCGENDLGFISTSGSQFQETYVGVGPKKIRELFKLARENKPCIIFIDEIDAVGRKRSSEDTSSANAERDSTLNQLLVELDGFKDSNGIFVIGATNRMDLLDSALIRPGRIDKKIYVGNPDKKTREEILKIHMKNKPIDSNIGLNKLVELTNGYSGAEIENLLNEAMLNALRNNKEIINQIDIDMMSNRILTGWQITENKLSDEMLLQVAIHEIGHALVGLYTKYKKLVKVSINLWSPKSLGFTLFEESLDDNVISTKEKLIKEIMVLLGGRIAEELFYGEKISSGALDDLNRVKAIIQKMIIDYGMGTSLFIPYNSDKYREKIDEEIELIFNDAYKKTKYLLSNSKLLIKECALILKIENEITEENIIKLMKQNYNYLMMKFD